MERVILTNKSKKFTTETGKELLCPIRYFQEIIGCKWKLPIICMLSSGEPTRYNTIKRRLTGISNMMLSQSLKEMESDSLVHRKQYNEVPPKVEYTLTNKGASLVPLLVQLVEWSKAVMQTDSPCGIYCSECQTTK
jgi:DNA-binding HxlR family transcriptional regulator